MGRRRITVDLCTYQQSTASANSSPYCIGKAAFTVGPNADQSHGVTDVHRVCLKHVGHAVEAISHRFPGAVEVRPDYDRSDCFSDDPVSEVSSDSVS